MRQQVEVKVHTHTGTSTEPQYSTFTAEVCLTEVPTEYEHGVLLQARKGCCLGRSSGR
jgi:hypothetical protein